MEVTIKIPKSTLRHLQNCDTYLDACYDIQRIIEKIKKQTKEVSQ